MVFYGFLKLMLFNEGFETHGILWRFLNPWYLKRLPKDFF